jgi:pimeloyl-ACP methyl ester carboxylesterase
MSALKWGTEPPELVELVLLHGGKQNAHTWDAVALALNRPLIALDLPSHGHSDTALDGLHEPDALAADIAEVMDQCAPRAKLLCGMSLGGLAAISLSALRPELVRRLVLVDVTPGITTKTGAPSSEEVISTGVEKSFATFGAMLSSVAARNPSRPHTWLRRNVLHNTVQRAEDEVWIWRYERYPRRHPRRCAFAALWDQLGATTAPTLLIRGTHSRMVDGSDEAELRRRLPTARVEHVQGAGHCVQSDQPLRLAALLDEFVQVPTAGAAHVPVQCRDLRIDLKCIEACQGL